ncbi:ATP-dependent helicase [Psychrobacillus sp. FSL H8-0510]|uniref:ATP-dependent helicase n=1 Tax=Psychrobacillus sp. FSL H8-0510 TaxID=2921394 RepID=UPI0030F630B6
MYTTLEKSFEKTAPLADIYIPNETNRDSEYYFQLLSDYGISLNPSQKEAVSTVNGPVLLIAGAGAGKTTALTCRIGYMIHTAKVDPSSILLVTFTKKASVEMVERLARIPGITRQASREVASGTYHSVCLRILREQGYDFSVLSSERRKHIMLKTILKRMGLQDEYSAETLASIISNWKNQMIRPAQVDISTPIMKELKDVYAAYEKMKDEQNLYDFDDMLLETYYLFTYEPSVLEIYQEKFKYILCDEFQDTSYVQYEIIRLLAEPYNNLCVVGDDSQTIYSFRSASYRYMVDFDKFYPNSIRVIMDINYRSVPSIVGFGNNIIHANTKQIKKTLQVVKSQPIPIYYSTPENSEEEANQIISQIKDKQLDGTSLKNIAIIYRTHATGRAIFDRLILADIPFVTYGKSNESFYQNTFIRPILALLRVVNNPLDVDAMIEAAPVFYISKADMQKTIDEVAGPYMGNLPNDFVNQALKRLADKKSGFQQRKLLEKVDALHDLKEMTAPQAIREIRKGVIGYDSQLEVDGRKTISIHKEVIAEILDEFEQASRGFANTQSFLSFIQRVEDKNREMEELRKIPDIEAVRLMTIHASKGLEFQVVYAIGWSEGILPHASSLDTKKREDSPLEPLEALEEERRLAYVCVTRAKESLYISAPKRHRDKEVEPSRFIEEGLLIAT